MKWIPRVVAALAFAGSFLAATSASAVWPELAGEHARGDFDGDGTLEVVVSSPEDDCGKGAVYVVDPVAGATERWTRDSTGILGTAECADFFGAALAVGDFDGDGRDDLVVGAPEADDSGVDDAGVIHVIYGSASGLTSSGDQVWHQNSTGIAGVAEVEDDFGSALTVGDFNCDGIDDIAIGVPMEDISGEVEAGAVHVLYGRASGLSSVDDFYRQGAGGVNGLSEAGDHFGASLAAGNFNGDLSGGHACDDLAIGIPDEEVNGTLGAGKIYALFGESTGLTTVGDQAFSQDVSSVEDTAQTNDRFGARLLVYDEDGDGFDDLGVIVPGDTCLDGHGVGRHVFPGSSTGLDTSDDRLDCDKFRCVVNDEDGLYGCVSYSDPVHASTFADTIEMFVGSDVVWARAGSDDVVGGAGNDVLFGGDGDDTLRGGPGLDVQVGGDGDDTFIVNVGCEALPGEVIDGGPGTDTVESHLSKTALEALGVSFWSVENFVLVAEGSGHCEPFPYEDGPFAKPKVSLTWDDLPSNSSVFSTTTGLVDLSLENETSAALDVQLRILLQVRGYLVPIHPASISVPGKATVGYTLDLNDFIPAGTSVQTIPAPLLELPVSAALLVHGRITESAEYAGSTAAPPVHGHLENGTRAVLYRASALEERYHGGNLLAWRARQEPVDPGKVQVAAIVPDP